MTMANANEAYCTFTLASDVTAGGLPSEAEIAKDLESSDMSVRRARRTEPWCRHMVYLPLQ